MSEPEASQFDVRVDRVVCAVADSEIGRIPLEHAILLALREAHTEVHVARVVAADASDDDISDARDELVATILGEVAQLSSADDPTPALWTHILPGDVIEELSALCENLSADHLILGPGREQGAETASALVRNPPCSVEIIQPKTQDTDRDDERRRRCPECAELRESSNGRRWFCDAHVGGAFHHFPVVASQSLRPTSFG